MPVVVPNTKSVNCRLAVHIICSLLAVFPFVYLHFIKGYIPTLRGFYCDDENLKHPYVKEVVKSNLKIFIKHL